MFQKKKPMSSGILNKEDDKDVQIISSVMGQSTTQALLQRSIDVYPTVQMEIVVGHLTEAMVYIRSQDVQIKNFVLQMDVLSQQKLELETQSAKSIKHDVLMEGIEQI